MRSPRLLAVAVTTAVAFAGAWLWRLGDDRPTYRRVDAASVTTAGVRFSGVSLRATPSVTDEFGKQVTAISGAVLVLVTVDYDASGRSEKLYCDLTLVAGDAAWRKQWLYSPPPPRVTTCTEGAAGTVAALYEIPQNYLASVEGIAVDVGEPPPVLLSARPG